MPRLMRWGGRITRHILAFQAVATAAAAGVGFLADGVAAAGSAAAGGVIGIAGMVLFSRRLFSAAPGSTARQMMRAFYLGAVGKIALTAALFAVAIIAAELPVLPLIGGYTATLVAYWLSLPFVVEETTGK